MGLCTLKGSPVEAVENVMRLMRPEDVRRQCTSAPGLCLPGLRARGFQRHVLCCTEQTVRWAERAGAYRQCGE